MVGFLKKLLGGAGDEEDKSGLYFYVRSDNTGEVIKVRLHRGNDLSLSDNNQDYFTRKVIVGRKSFDRIEANFYFDKNKNFVSADISGGALVDRAAYDAYLAGQSGSTVE